MPIMGGYTATLEIRKHPAYVSLPIFAMTADALGGVKEKCMEVGMQDFITKPINPNQLHDVVRRWLQQQESPQSNSDSTASTTNLLQLPEMDSIDQQDGLSHVRGNRVLYHKLLKQFRNGYRFYRGVQW